MMKILPLLFWVNLSIRSVWAFTEASILYHKEIGIYHTTLRKMSDDKKTSESKTGDNKAMAFLRKIGKVGGAANKDFVNAMGVDEGPVGKNTAEEGMKNIRKAKSAYKECTISGVIDDLTEPFPFTSSGTQWSGFTDHVMGGKSSGTLCREEVNGRMANVLRGKVSLENNGGFVQMATDLAVDPGVKNTVDASKYDGIEIDVLFQDENKSSQTFNLHLRNPACLRQFSSYRSTFCLENEGEWCTIRIPWSEFVGHGPGSSEIAFQENALRRIGILAIGKEMEVFLAISGVRFFSVI